MSATHERLKKIRSNVELAEKVYRAKVDTHGWAETYLLDIIWLLEELKKKESVTP